MIRLDDEKLRDVQMTELEILMEADRICRKCGIHYNIIAGTLLGAVRHGGYIPWDDDADIALLREDYEKFRKACETELDHERFYFQDHSVTPGYRWGYGKLRRKDSLFLREHQEHMPYEQGIFIDVFPLDAVPQSHLGRTLKNFECFVIRKALWSKVGAVAEKNTAVRCVYKLMNLIPEKTIRKRLDRLIDRSRSVKSDWVRILMFPTPNNEYAYRREWYEHSADTIFEGHVFQGIRDYDAYLSFKFGNYMELPPESQRKTHPVSALKIPGKEMIRE